MIAANTLHLVAACFAMVVLTAVVGVAMLLTRVREMRGKRIHPQSVSTSHAAAECFERVQPADNFRNLFEAPVLFYALAATALATRAIPNWLVIGAWVFVALRVLHSLIHCTYNTVLHRLAVFMASFGLIVGMWVAYFFGLLAAA